MLALVRLTRASKPAARKCSPEGGEGGGKKKKPETLYAAKHSLRRMMIPHSHQIWIKTFSISLPNGDEKKPPKWWMSLGPESPRGLEGRRDGKNRPASSVLVCVCPFPGGEAVGEKLFCKKLRAKNRGNKSVDGRVWNCVLYPPPVNRFVQLNCQPRWFCFLRFDEKERERIDLPTSNDESRWKRGEGFGSFRFNSRNFGMSEFKIGKSGTRDRVKSVGRIHRTRNFGLFIRCLVARPFPPPRHRLVRRNSRYCVGPFCHLFSAHFQPRPWLSLSSLSLPFSSLPARLWIPRAERGGRVHAERQRCASRRKGKWWRRRRRRRKTRVGYLIRARESFLQRVLHYPRQEIREKFEHPPR